MQWYFDGRRIRTLTNEYHQLYALPCTHEGQDSWPRFVLRVLCTLRSSRQHQGTQIGSFF